MRKVLLTMVCWVFICSIALSGFCQEQEKDFYIYCDKNSPLNHFIPSGFMGDHNDIKFNDQATDEVATGSTSIKIIYTAKASQGNKWAGIYWQSAQHNWGTRKSGYDLSEFNKLVFQAKGVAGGEVISEVKVGGITTNATTGEPVAFPDSLTVKTGPIRLTTEWQEYSVNLVGEDLSYVNGGLVIAFDTALSQGEQTIYLDDIRYINEEGLQKESKSTNFPFYVYADSASLDNHYIASGFMPSTASRDIKLDTNWQNYPFSGDTCIRVGYKNISGTRWAGIFWQNPANNWGTVPNAGFDLQGASKLTFWARGDKGGELISEFKMGGLASGEYFDSDSASISQVQLTKEWKKYEIDLRGRDLSYIIGGFCWSTSIDVNDPEGIVFYLDEVKYEK